MKAVATLEYPSEPRRRDPETWQDRTPIRLLDGNFWRLSAPMPRVTDVGQSPDGSGLDIEFEFPGLPESAWPELSERFGGAAKAFAVETRPEGRAAILLDIAALLLMARYDLEPEEAALLLWGPDGCGGEDAEAGLCLLFDLFDGLFFDVCRQTTIRGEELIAARGARAPEESSA